MKHKQIKNLQSHALQDSVEVLLKRLPQKMRKPVLQGTNGAFGEYLHWKMCVELKRCLYKQPYDLLFDQMLKSFFDQVDVESQNHSNSAVKAPHYPNCYGGDKLLELELIRFRLQERFNIQLEIFIQGQLHKSGKNET